MNGADAKQGRRRILFVLPTLNLAGSQTVVVELARGLDRDCYDLAVCCLLGFGHFEAELRDVGAELHLLRPAGLKDVRLPFRLARLIRESGVDLVSSHYHPFDFWVAAGARLAGVPCVVTKHSTHDNDPYPPLLRSWIERWTQRLATGYVAVSESVADHMVQMRGIDPDGVQVVYNGVDPAPFGRRGAYRESARAEFGYGPAHRVVGTVANLHRRTKGYEVLVEAIPAVVREFPDARFLWVGVDLGGFAAELTERAAELGVADHLTLAGRRDDVPRLLAAMDLFVLPSTFEGLGIVLIEAMASGLPVVASEVGGIPEVVVDGETGALIPVGNRDALVSAIAGLLRDEERAARQARAGRERAHECFSVAAMVRGYEAVFASL
jgi:glycosyltransferase involved in cell wall biosynthesis